MPSRSTSIILGALLSAALFFAGYYTANWQRDSHELAVVKTQNNTTDKTNATRQDAKNANLVRQRDAQRDFHEGVMDDTVKTDDLLQRVLLVTDRLRFDTTNSGPPASENNAATDTSGADAREARLRGALRYALDASGREAKRANEVTRKYNLCLATLESDRQQVATAQQ